MRDPAELMRLFAERTGLSPAAAAPRRYLWTDAFAVCNLLGLGQHLLAAELVDQVHHVLGQHRQDDRRSGWLSGLPPAEAEAHPTRGGLRIGKPLPERGPDDPFDPALEWDRDGQYYHYLLKWMHALDQLSRHTGDPRGNLWARELATTAHRAFVHASRPGAPRRIFWKMSVDLGWPQVTSMGHHDPLDGLITCWQLIAHHPSGAGGPDLRDEAAALAEIASGLDWTTDDPLGLGGLLTDAHRLAQLAGHALDGGRLLAAVLEAAVVGLDAYLRQRPFSRPAAERLAFRELGLAIGLHAAERMVAGPPLDGAPGVGTCLGLLSGHFHCIEAIEACWSEPAHQRLPSWRDHLDINSVMLATSLAPAGYLSLAPAP